MTTLRAKAREALLWGAGFRIVRDAAGFAAMLVLVRLVAPAEYGRFGLLGSVMGFIGLFSAKQVLAHVVQEDPTREPDYRLHFSFGVVVQAALFVVTNLVAVVLRYSSNYGPVAPLLHVVSVGLLLELPAELRSRMLERALDFRRQRLLNIAGTLVTIAVSVGLALAGAGVYALVVPPMLATLPFTIDLFVSARWRPAWRWDLGKHRAALRFAASRVGSGVVNGARDLLQNGLFVRFFGYVLLGMFGRAVGLANLVIASLTAQVVNNVYPVLTRSDPSSPAFRKAAGLLFRGVAWISIPVAALFALLAAPVVLTVYGRAWEGVVPLLPAAMLESAVRSVAFALYMLLLAAREEGKCLAQDALTSSVIVALLFLALRGGAARYLVLLAGVEALGALLMAYWLIRGKRIEPASLVSALVPSVVATGAGAAALWGARRGLGWSDPGFWQASALGAVFVLTHAAIVRAAFSRDLRELLDLVPGGGRVARALSMAPAHGTAS